MRCVTIRSALLLGVLLISPAGLGAQTGSWGVSVPSPTAASLGRFGDVPVSLYTGVPDIAMPLFTVRGRTLELPITLRYHASGIRVEDIGGWVGLGWALDAGGVITRSIHGLVDEWSNGFYYYGRTFYDPQGWEWPSFSFPTFAFDNQNSGSPSWTTIQGIAQGLEDGEPDQFFFNFGGQSGEIALGPMSGSVNSQDARTIPYRNWRIQPTIVSNVITTWVITTEDGTRYTFGAAGARETHTDRNYAGGPLWGQPYASSWYLTGIRAPGGDSITLQYQSYNAEHEMGTAGEQRDEWTPACGGGGTFSSTNRYQVTWQRLSAVVAAAHTVTFTTSLRADALSAGVQQIPTGTPQEPRLDTMIVSTPSGTVLRRFRFAYDYSLGNRLTLTSVFEEDSSRVPLPPYALTYAGPVLPDRTSYAVDHWGYYNGRTANATYVPPGRSPHTGTFFGGADRRPDSASMHAGALTRITYPTGGYSEFVYEPNDYSWIYTGASLTDSGPPQSKSVQSSATFPGVRDSAFVLGGLDSVNLQVSVFVSNPPQCQQNCPYAELLDANLVLKGGPWYQSASYNIRLPQGTYHLRASEAGYGTTVVISANWRELVSVARKAGGGLRIAELRTADAMGAVSVRRYRYRQASDTTHSSGMIESEPWYGYWFSGEADPYKPFDGHPEELCQFYSRSFTNKMPLGGGPPVVYSEVTVLEGASGEFGRTRHTFLLGDRPPEYHAWGVWPYHRRTSFFWRWGRETAAETYDASGRLQRSLTSLYAFRADTQTTRELHGISVASWNLNGIEATWGTYRVESAWTHPSSQTVTVYDTTGTTSFATTTTYGYANPNHAQLTQITEINSDGTQRIARLRYPLDYAAGGGNPEAVALTAMQGSVHMPGVVIERTVSRRVGALEQVVDGVLTTYRLFGTDQYLPYQRFILNSPGPIP